MANLSILEQAGYTFKEEFKPEKGTSWLIALLEVRKNGKVVAHNDDKFIKRDRKGNCQGAFLYFYSEDGQGSKSAVVTFDKGVVKMLDNGDKVYQVIATDGNTYEIYDNDEARLIEGEFVKPAQPV